MMKAALFCLLSALLFAGIYADCFFLGSEGVTPPSKYTQVTLDMLKGSYGPLFFKEYNANGGLNFYSTGLTTTSCLITFGNLTCVYVGSDSTNYLAPYLSSTRNCVWSSVSYRSLIGSWNSYTYYPTMNSSVFNTWTATRCAYTYAHWTLLYDTTCGSVPTPAPTNNPTSPPSEEKLCCLYYSKVERYQSYFCQKDGYKCPTVTGFELYANFTGGSCADCDISNKRDVKQMF